MKNIHDKCRHFVRNTNLVWPSGFLWSCCWFWFRASWRVFWKSSKREEKPCVWFNVTWRYYRALATTQRPLHRCTVGTDVSSHELRKHFHMFRPERIAAPATLQIWPQHCWSVLTPDCDTLTVIKQKQIEVPSKKRAAVSVKLRDHFLLSSFELTIVTSTEPRSGHREKKHICRLCFSTLNTRNANACTQDTIWSPVLTFYLVIEIVFLFNSET